MFLLTAYYVIFYMYLLFTLWRMNKYQSINQSNTHTTLYTVILQCININLKNSNNPNTYKHTYMLRMSLYQAHVLLNNGVYRPYHAIH